MWVNTPLYVQIQVLYLGRLDCCLLFVFNQLMKNIPSAFQCLQDGCRIRGEWTDFVTHSTPQETNWDNGVSQEVYPAFNEEVNVTTEEEVATVMNFDTGEFRIYLTGFHACWCTHKDMEKRNLLIMQHARKEMFCSQCVYPYECHYWWNQKETNSMKNYLCIRQKLISSWNYTYIG